MKARVLATGFFLSYIICFLPLLHTDDALNAARKEYVLHFFSVDAHVNLARQQYEQGERLQAFYTLETARREHFGAAEFASAFRRIFLNDAFENSPQAEAAVKAKVEASPNDEKALAKLADIYISRKEWTKAIPLLESAIKLRPDEFAEFAALARVYREMDHGGKAGSTIQAWTKAHPQALETYQTRIDDLLAKEGSDARPLVNEALAKYPNDPTLHFNLGIVLERANDLPGTQREFDTAVRLGPKIPHIVGWVARFYFMRKIDLQHALDLYLSVYFLDPEFYETEYAEDRIRKLAPQVVLQIMEQAEQQSGRVGPVLLTLKPAVEKVLLRGAPQQNWDAQASERMMLLMGSEDEVNRATAMQLVVEHPNPDAEKQVFLLLDDPDVLKRGMAGFVAMKWNTGRALPIVKKWLDDPAELVRFDALSALMEAGGSEGHKVVEEYARSGKEQNANLRNMISHGISK